MFSGESGRATNRPGQTDKPDKAHCATPGNAPNSKDLGPDEDQCATWDNAPNPSCYSSFGDGGTTASVGAYGHLMQINQYLQAGRSGMFSMVSRQLEEPRWPVTRTRDLNRLSRCASTSLWVMSVGLELKIPGLLSRKRPPQLKWINWRWPRFDYSLPESHLKVSLQWIIRDHTVIQQWTVRNTADKDVDINVQFGRDMWIQDLEYVDYKNNYNGRRGDCGQFERAGPRDYGWVLMHPFDESMQKTRSTEWTTLSSGCTTQFGDESSANQAPQFEKKGVATAVMAVFVDGTAHKFEGSRPAGDQWTENLKGGATMEITAAYKIILVPDAILDYRNFVIPSRAANVALFLSEEDSIQPYSLSSIDLGEKHIGARRSRGELSTQVDATRAKSESDNAGTKILGSASLAPHERRNISKLSGSPTISPEGHWPGTTSTSQYGAIWSTFCLSVPSHSSRRH